MGKPVSVERRILQNELFYALFSIMHNDHIGLSGAGMPENILPTVNLYRGTPEAFLKSSIKTSIGNQMRVRASAKNKSTILLALWPVYCVVSTGTYPQGGCALYTNQNTAHHGVSIFFRDP